MFVGVIASSANGLATPELNGGKCKKMVKWWQGRYSDVGLRTAIGRTSRVIRSGRSGHFTTGTEFAAGCHDGQFEMRL